MKTRMLFPSILLLLSLVLGACRSAGTDPSSLPKSTGNQPIATGEQLISSLKAAGADVETLDEVHQPFFPVTGKVIRLNGGEVQVFEYGNVDESREAASSVSPNGSSIGTTMVSWLATPHFYMAGNVIALYVGEDQAVIDLLEAVLGPQFAGG